MTDPVEPVGSVSSSSSKANSLLSQQARDKQESQQAMNAAQTGSVGSSSSGSSLSGITVPGDNSNWINALNSNDACKTYSCYMLFIDVVNHLQLDGLQNQMIVESQLMDVQHQMQQSLVTIGNFITQLEGNAQSGGSWEGLTQYGLSSDPNMFNGLQQTFYKLGISPSDYGQEQVSSDYQKGVEGFVKAFKQLFYANTDTTAPLFEAVQKIQNPKVYPTGKDFDLTSFWGNVNQTFSSFNQCGYNVFATQPGEHISLIQQYCYLKAEAAVYTGSKESVNGADGDITKLVNFNYNDEDCDSFLQSVMQVVVNFSNSATVSRGESSTDYFTTKTSSPLYLILNEQYNAFPQSQGPNPNTQTTQSGDQVGLYGYFSYETFNYFWQKNPDATTSPNTPTPTNGVFWEAVTKPGLLEGDHLSQDELSINGLQTNLGSDIGAGSVSVQSITSNEGQDVSIVQSGLDGKKDSDSTVMQNQLSS